MCAAHVRVLLVEDAPQDLEILRDLVASAGHEPVVARRLDEARRRLEADRIDLVVSDMRLPDGSGADLLVEAGDRPVILATAYGEVEEAVEAMRRGAFHYLAKPLRPDEVRVLVERAAAQVETARELERLRDLEGRAVLDGDLVARSRAMREVVETARAAAASDATVLLLGESGTGKEIIARAIHRLSARARGPLVAVHCGAIPATLLEADLFGHERGAFTGATGRRAGKFERAHRGTLFLDEIGTMPVELQSRLLRVIQEREVERIGAEAPVKVDIRLVAASNRDLAAAVRAGAFREDLFYRLNVVPIRLPPLRERREEIPHLVAFFLRRREVARAAVEPAALAALGRHDWPGNVRELENAVERALVLSGGGKILLRHLPDEVRGGRPATGAGPAGGPDETGGIVALEEAKRRAVEAALATAGGRREEAARLLGVHRNTLRSLIRRYRIGAAPSPPIPPPIRPAVRPSDRPAGRSPASRSPASRS